MAKCFQLANPSEACSWVYWIILAIKLKNDVPATNGVTTEKTLFLAIDLAV